MNKSLTLLVGGAILVAGTGLYAQKAGDAKAGKEVFDNNCSVCHNADSADVKIGPGLKGLFKKPKMATTGKAPTDANVLAKISEGGNGMPPYGDTLSDAEKANIIAYLKTL